MGEILFIAHRIPFPPDRGDKIRSWNMVRKLDGIAPVHIAAFADDERDMAHAPALSEVAASHRIVLRDRNRPLAAMRGIVRGQPLSVALFDHPELRAYVARILAERPISAIFAYSCQVAQYVPERLNGIRFVMDFVDVDSAKYAAYGQNQRGPMGWVNRREGRKLLAFERKVAVRADASLFVSEAEAALFRDASGLGVDRVLAVDNGVDLAFFNPAAGFEPLTPAERGEGPLIVFTGQMDYRPNVEAVEGFSRYSFAQIRRRYPDARFAIVGRNPSPAVRALASLPGVVVTGGVPDVRGWLAAADVVVAPLRLARGVQNKVLEAMAMARPVVASPQAAEGIDAVAGRDLLVAGTDGDEAAAVLDLLADRDAALRLGRAARARVEARYSWDATLAMLPDIVRGVEHPIQKKRQSA
jgi:polysaccharide biosynthesis protein PslH